MSEIFLGRLFSISGRVAHGDKQGRTIGFPTANVSIRRQLSPVLGVFCVNIHKDNKKAIMVYVMLGKDRPRVSQVIFN